MAKSSRDQLIADEIKNIIIDNATYQITHLLTELKSRGIKGIGANQILRCIKLAGCDVYNNIVGRTYTIANIREEKNSLLQKRQNKQKISIRERPKGGEEFYKSMLKESHLKALDKEAGIYGICIDGICVYVGQSINLLHRMADHQYWAVYEPNNSPNYALYKLMHEALKRKIKVSFVFFVLIDHQMKSQAKTTMLNMLESEIIHSKLPIANKIIPDANGNMENMQVLYVDEQNIDLFFTPNFNEHREFLDVDLRSEYYYVFNPYYDEKIKNKSYQCEIGLELKQYSN